MTDRSWKEQLLNKSKWVRAVFMALFLVVSFLIRLLVGFITVFQLIMVLVTDKPNKRLVEFSQSLSVYAYQVIRFLTYNSEHKPYPFASWPNPKEKVS